MQKQKAKLSQTWNIEKIWIKLNWTAWNIHQVDYKVYTFYTPNSIQSNGILNYRFDHPIRNLLNFISIFICSTFGRFTRHATGHSSHSISYFQFIFTFFMQSSRKNDLNRPWVKLVINCLVVRRFLIWYIWVTLIKNNGIMFFDSSYLNWSLMIKFYF